MMNAGDIVLVAFPYADRTQEKYRPALVVSENAFHKTHGLCWAVMITSSENAAWEGDVPLPEKGTGLRKASIIRTAKIATLDLTAIEKIGSVTPATMRRVKQWLLKGLQDPSRTKSRD